MQNFDPKDPVDAINWGRDRLFRTQRHHMIKLLILEC